MYPFLRVYVIMYIFTYQLNKTPAEPADEKRAKNMRTFAQSTPETLIAFHIGRGGQFWNSGHKSYCDQDTPIDNYTDDLFTSFENEEEVADLIGDRENLRDLFEEAIYNDGAAERLKRWGLDLGDKIYVTASGTPVGLEVQNNGTGKIDIDGDYDTTYVIKLEDCDDEELWLIYNSNNYVSDDVRDYCKEQLHINEEEEVDEAD